MTADEAAKDAKNCELINQVLAGMKRADGTKIEKDSCDYASLVGMTFPTRLTPRNVEWWGVLTAMLPTTFAIVFAVVMAFPPNLQILVASRPSLLGMAPDIEAATRFRALAPSIAASLRSQRKTNCFFCCPPPPKKCPPTTLRPPY